MSRLCFGCPLNGDIHDKIGDWHAEDELEVDIDDELFMGIKFGISLE